MSVSVHVQTSLTWTNRSVQVGRCSLSSSPKPGTRARGFQEDSVGGEEIC